MNNFIKIDYTPDIAPLLAALEKQEELWNQHTLRTAYPGSAHSEVSDIWLRFNDFSKYKPEDYYLIFDDLESVNYPAWNKLPEAQNLIMELIDKVDANEVGRVIITRMPPGAKITPHIDEGKYAELYKRYHIILKNNTGSIFRCGDEVLCMETGGVYWFDTSKEHEVINNSNDIRITLIVDLL